MGCKDPPGGVSPQGTQYEVVIPQGYRVRGDHALLGVIIPQDTQREVIIFSRGQ